jgi:hypothetical protein
MELRNKEKAFSAAAHALFATCVGIDEVNAELRNTLANVYFRFYLSVENLDLPLRALRNGTGLAASIAQAEILSDMKYAPDAFKIIRKAIERKDKVLVEFFSTGMLDSLKYDITDVANKSAARRFFERKFKTPKLEIDGLYDGMRDFVMSERSKPSHVA